MDSREMDRRRVRDMLERWAVGEQPSTDIINNIMPILAPHKRRILSAYYTTPRGSRRWSDVAQKEFYSEKYTERLAREAINQIAEVMNGN